MLSLMRTFKLFIQPRNLTRRFFINTMEKDNLFVRHVNDDDIMKINFRYGEGSFPDREFTFMRLKQEKLSDTFQRMKVKIENVMLQKLSKKRKSKTNLQNEANIKTAHVIISAVKNGKMVDGDALNINTWTEGTQVIINGRTFNVIENAPNVLQIALPKILMVGFPAFPDINLEFCDEKDSNFTWYRNISDSEKKENDDGNMIFIEHLGKLWFKVGEHFVYTPSTQDLDHAMMLICLPKHGERCGKACEVISKDTVKFGPEKCPFEYRHEYTRELSKSGSFRCISYNLLADSYADTDTARNELFSHCPPEFLDYEYRRQLLVKEIIGYNGDLLCFQEVDRTPFKKYLAPILSTEDLHGIYNEKGGKTAEGLACFYRSKKFRLISSEGILLNEVVSNNPSFEDIWNKVCENEKLKERILSRTTSLQIAVLESLDKPNSQILLGNTHLFFHPESDNIRLIQASICVRYLEITLKKLVESNPSTTTAVILTGDFNSCPEFGVLQYITSSNLPGNCIDWQSNPEESVDGLSLCHSMSLGSACGTPAYTNYTVGFHGCLDYIFYDKNWFSVEEVVPLPAHEVVTKHVALPNEQFPSDHLAIICTLKWLL